MRPVSHMPLSEFIMGILDFIWSSRISKSSDEQLIELNKQGWHYHSLENVSFKQADVNLRVTGGNGKATFCDLSVDRQIIHILESNIEDFIRADYPFETIPFTGEMRNHFLNTQ